MLECVYDRVFMVIIMYSKMYKFYRCTGDSIFKFEFLNIHIVLEVNMNSVG